MKKHSDLFLLINSFKPVEVRYIIKYLTLKTDKKSDLLLLFKAYKNPKNKNDQEVKEGFIEKKFYSSFETKKYYLYRTILKALHSYDYSRREDENCLSQINSLTDRGLNEQALRMCLSSIKKLEKKEEFELLLPLFGRAIDLKIIQEKKTNHLFKKKQECIVKVEQINDLRQIYVAVRNIIKRYTFIRSEEHLSKLENIMLQLKTMSEHELLSTRAKLVYNEIYYQYFGSLSLWEKTKGYSENKAYFLDKLNIPDDDVIRLNNEANIYLVAIENNELSLEEEKRNVLMKYIEDQCWDTHNEHVIRFVFYILVGLNKKQIGATIEKTLKTHVDFAEKLKDSEHSNDRIALLYYFELAKSFFQIKAYDEASKWNYKVMYLADKNEWCYDLFSFASILNMIIDYHKKEFKLWENHFDNAIRKIKKKEVYYDFEKLFMSFARKNLPDLASKSLEERRNAFLKFKDEVDREISKPFSKGVSNYFDFSSWAKNEATVY